MHVPSTLFLYNSLIDVWAEYVGGFGTNDGFDSGQPEIVQFEDF